MNNNIFKNKTVLVTGHTGFKGSWLATWLSQLGAIVTGISNQVPTEPSHFELIKKCISKDLRIDIKDPERVYKVINDLQPDYIFHLAAQPIVLEAYSDPLDTFHINAIGTANMLDALRRTNHKCIAIMITSDKCYDNVEWTYGYRETDKLGGKDPYSGSKGAAELIIRSYVESFFKKPESNVCVAIGRAGNVIGGGDWASYRIVPDCVRSWSKGQIPEVRNPFATRPWQHVLEPLSGYLTLACKLSEDDSLNGDPFNFGPSAYQNHTVKELIKEIIAYWPESDWIDKSADNALPHEAGLLKLNCDKALHSLQWKSTLNFKETAKWTGEWYRTFYNNGPEISLELTNAQIEEYMNLAKERNSFKLM